MHRQLHLHQFIPCWSTSETASSLSLSSLFLSRSLILFLSFPHCKKSLKIAQRRESGMWWWCVTKGIINKDFPLLTHSSLSLSLCFSLLTGIGKIEKWERPCRELDSRSRDRLPGLEGLNYFEGLTILIQGWRSKEKYVRMCSQCAESRDVRRSRLSEPSEPRLQTLLSLFNQSDIGADTS